ncbi:disulfide bond formation protein B [Roseovarius albus]|uniref:Disulfide bond formation protein B n=1 Tax=Roseovarius albus TaxID=1247867 RepID=A0A1X7A1U0_9RHOB|nr:disulfide bond formation protein B [Roseovarius albus]SLN67691.1 disulfide bond formation protein B [Roseovarius albus]
MITQRTLIFLATAGSALTLAMAFGFQHIGGMAPCKLCLWQRWPHAAAIAIGAIALALPARLLCWLGALAALTTAAFGGYHTGVERGWWEGPATCTSAGTSGLTSDELFDQIMAAPVIRCDEVPWELFTLSMASWNMLLSLGLAALWIMAARRA